MFPDIKGSIKKELKWPKVTKVPKAWLGQDASNAENNVNNNCISQHHFSHKTVFVDSATIDDHTQPSTFLSNLKYVRNSQPIYLTTTLITKSSYTR